MNDALESNLHVGSVDNIADVGAINKNVDVSEDVLKVLGNHDQLTAQHSDLLQEAADLDAHAGKDAPLGSEAYAEYLAAVEAFNDKVTAFNEAADEYNTAVDTYNTAVDTYNESATDEVSNPTTDSATSQSSADIDWGNINVKKDFDHVDVKYNAAASKTVQETTDSDGNVTTEYVDDTLTEYTVTGVYADESAYEAQKDNSKQQYSVSYTTDSNATEKVHNVQKDNANNEFGNPSHSGANVDPVEGKVSFYVTLEDSNGDTHGITVNMDAGSVYAEGSYYKAESNDFLKDYVGKDGRKLETVTIDGEEYYDVSGESVFLISALTCDGMSKSGGSSGNHFYPFYPGYPGYPGYGNNSDNNNDNAEATLNPDGLDLILNMQTMIEIHQSESAKKVTYFGYEFGKTAQAEAPAEAGEMPVAPTTPIEPTFVPEAGNEPVKPNAPTEPTFVPEAGNEPVKPNAPTEPTFVPEAGNEPVKPNAPTEPTFVPEAGNEPVKPNAPTEPTFVPEAGDEPTAPNAPVEPDFVPEAGDEPTAPNAPVEPDFVPEAGDEPTAPNAPTEPTFVPEAGNEPTAPNAPVEPDFVPEAGDAPVAPIAPEAPDEVSTPGEAPVAPIAPEAPAEVGTPGDAPVAPGEFDQTAPNTPSPTVRLDHVEKLEELEEKVIVVIDPVDPFVPADDPIDPPAAPIVEIEEEEVPLVELPEIVEEPTVEIEEEEVPLAELPDEDVPLAEVPKTGDRMGLWLALLGLSLAGLTLLKKKEKRSAE